MEQLKKAREEHGFQNVWTHDGKILFKENGSNSTKIFYGYVGQTSICIVEKRRLCLDTVFFHLGLGKGFIWFYLGLTLDCFSYNF